GLGDILGLLGL
uniref:Rubellidin-4.1 n=1 Tax=Litoria rubella TaxID=104895 RepID=RBE41_LITRU|nr:RecName: Full=Rubellidin-4.1 [Litoria rubella]